MGGDGSRCARQPVRDDVELVGVGSLVTVAADRGGGNPDHYAVTLNAVTFDGTDDIAQAVGRGSPGQGGAISAVVEASGKAGDGVGNSEVEAGGERVGELPGLGAGVESPLLQPAGVGGAGGVGIGVGGGAIGVDAIAFVG